MPDNLPGARTSFVGRTEEMRTLTRITQPSGLLTLTGAGGSGKTRLLLELARSLVARFPGGVWWVDLSPVPVDGSVARAIASCLHVGDQAAVEMLPGLLVDQFRGRSLALALDNCEHLVDAVGMLVDQLLSACPSLLVVATSREPLRVAGEITYLVQPLRISDEAVALFTERAQAARPDLEVTETDRRQVQEICRQLDGMPLAIELAARWVRMMSLADLQARLADRFSLLVDTTRGVSGRQRTLRAAVEWSHDRLSVEQRILFQRLSVFSGSFSLPAVEAICWETEGGLGSARVVHVLAALCDHSMVVSQAGAAGSAGETRYLLLETLREYGLERLRDAEEEAALRRRHFDYFLRRAEGADDAIHTTGSDAELMALASDLDNIRSALRWGLEADPDAALALAAALDQLWVIIGAAEGGRWIEEALTRTAQPSRARARALSATVLAIKDEPWQRARERIEESLEICTELGDARGRAWALHMMGLSAWVHGRLDVARGNLSQALVAHEELGNVFAIERTLLMLGNTLINVAGAGQEGSAYLARAASMARELKDRWSEQYAFSELALASMDEGDGNAARGHVAAALACGDRGAMTSVSLVSAARVVAGEDPRVAAALLGAARVNIERMAGRRVFHVAVCNHKRAARLCSSVREALGPDRFRQAWDEGHAMSTVEALAQALEAVQQRVTPARGGLTPREVEITRLVTAGLANQEVAHALHLSVRTVEAHLDHIFTKLGLNTRTKLAAWARESGLDT